jgi:serine-type D-Ala-D-Ala carboxypeptidase/endopeptidase (penicillin-binding protein 4)
MLRRITRCLLPFAAAFLGVAAMAATPVGIPAVDAALARAKVPADALVAVVKEVDVGRPRLSWQADRPFNPASLMKLVTTEAALDLLGPAWTWSTPVWLNGAIVDGVLEGDLVIKGTGDPKLVVERLWLLLQRVQQRGVREIRGDIVLDRSAFVVPEQNPADFDGEPLRPYNVQPDALLINFRSLTLTLRPDPARGMAVVTHRPALAGVQVPQEVPLVPGECGDWRRLLEADFSDPLQLRLAGRYPAGCGERTWNLAYADPASYNARAITALWQALGGSLAGQVRDGPSPAGLAPAFELTSPPLADVVRDQNRFSNNVMAQQLFLTLGRVQRGQGTLEAAREVVTQQLRAHAGCRTAPLQLDNGSGRSRTERITARCLGGVLDDAWARPWMPELLASLPVAGRDTAGYARSAAGQAHLKTGSLRDVAALAGIVHAAGGRRYVVVAILNHPQATTAPARAVLDAVLGWALARKD